MASSKKPILSHCEDDLGGKKTKKKGVNCMTP